MNVEEIRKAVLWCYELEVSDDHADAIEEAAVILQAALCVAYGHEPVRDQCDRPEHDFCVWCRAITPGEAKR